MPFFAANLFLPSSSLNPGIATLFDPCQNPAMSAFDSALILTGPTACGKTALALELADRVGAEIVALDSMTTYRGMDVGTAKPTPEERIRIQHHLIDVLDPWESLTVAWWLDRAAVACREIVARGK